MDSFCEVSFWLHSSMIIESIFALSKVLSLTATRLMVVVSVAMVVDFSITDCWVLQHIKRLVIKIIDIIFKSVLFDFSFIISVYLCVKFYNR